MYEKITTLDKKEAISFLQRVIIINSILYYELDNPRMSDKDFDSVCKKLVDMQKEYGIEDTQYEYCMSDFDGNTGFDLYSRLKDSDREYLTHIAKKLSVSNKKESKKSKKQKKGKLF